MKTQKHLKKRWYNEECRTTIEEMKKAREEWLIKGRREMKSRSITEKETKHTK
jgi:hypothetical protein